MTYWTQPVAHPKRTFESRSHAIEEELLIDVSDLDATTLPLPIALTAALWDATERMPFGEIGRVPLAARVRHIVRKGSAALERAHAYFGAEFPIALHRGFIQDYAVDLPLPRCSVRQRFVRMHVGPDETGEVCATIGWPDQF